MEKEIKKDEEDLELFKTNVVNLSNAIEKTLQGNSISVVMTSLLANLGKAHKQLSEGDRARFIMHTIEVLNEQI